MANLQVYFSAIYPFFALTVTNKHHKYFLQDNFLSEVSDEGDLGVIVDHQLKFSSHAKSVSSSANKTLGIIKRTISSRHPRVFMKLYKALVCPRLEVGMSLAAPFFKKDKKLLEDVQHRAMNKFPYEERLRRLKLPMLTYQRKRGDIILTKKILSKNTLPGLFAQPLHSGTRGLLAAPFFKKDKKLLEDVQHSATKMVSNMNKFPYEEKLRRLKLPTLTYQRKRGDIILTKKILSKNTLPGLFAQPLHSGTRGHSLKLSMQHSTSRHRSHFFRQRIINTWNQLFEETVSATSTDMFKSHLDREWLCQEFLYKWEAAESSTRV